ncbi:glycoside hydrolase family 5 protein [Pollutibacter soli]|uniref:glycoside hydrolase family 5 protein n=1 Tax=Pollutibacter soli TaxID=3034157 RepID=UPI003013C43A
MRQIIFYVFALFFFLGCKSHKSQKSATGFKIHRGTNIAHWLSQSSARGINRQQFFTSTDIKQIKAAGFDHIRLPVDEEQLWDSTGKRESAAFALLDSCLHWAKKENLRVVLDLHILRSHYFNAAVKPLWTDVREQDKFILLWKDLASAVNKYPNDMLAYEFMNEPVADDPQEWNRLLARVTDSIRNWERYRVLVIGSNRWQSVNTFDQLIIPPGDKNIILSFHFYEPFMLSHYKASWTYMKEFNGTVAYPGQIAPGGTSPQEQRIYNIDSLEKMLSKPLHLADSLRLPLYCGEFGIIQQAPRESKLNWYNDMITIFNKHHIAWANWNYKSGSFGIVDRNRTEDKQIITILQRN